MSAQNTLSRREALSLLGGAAGSVVVTTSAAQTAGVRAFAKGKMYRLRELG